MITFFGYIFLKQAEAFSHLTQVSGISPQKTDQLYCAFNPSFTEFESVSESVSRLVVSDSL